MSSPCEPGSDHRCWRVVGVGPSTRRRCWARVASSSPGPTNELFWVRVLPGPPPRRVFENGADVPVEMAAERQVRRCGAVRVALFELAADRCRRGSPRHVARRVPTRCGALSAAGRPDQMPFPDPPRRVQVSGVEFRLRGERRNRWSHQKPRARSSARYVDHGRSTVDRTPDARNFEALSSARVNLIVISHIACNP